MNSEVKGLSYTFLGQKIPQLPMAVNYTILIHKVKKVSCYLNLFGHNISL